MIKVIKYTKHVTVTFTEMKCAWPREMCSITEARESKTFQHILSMFEPPSRSTDIFVETYTGVILAWICHRKCKTGITDILTKMSFLHIQNAYYCMHHVNILFVYFQN